MRAAKNFAAACLICIPIPVSAEEVMNEEQLKAFFVGNTLVYENNTSKGIEHAKRFYGMDGRLFAFHEYGMSDGKWDISNGKICMSWNVASWRPSCITGIIEEIGEDTYRTPRPNGTFFQFKVVPGDAYEARSRFE